MTAYVTMTLLTFSPLVVVAAECWVVGGGCSAVGKCQQQTTDTCTHQPGPASPQLGCVRPAGAQRSNTSLATTKLSSSCFCHFELVASAPLGTCLELLTEG